MKKILILIILVTTIIMVVMESIYAREENMDESLFLLIGARNAAEIGLTEKAITRYEAYLEKKPEDNIVKLEFADLLQHKGFYARAEKYYEYLVKNIGSIAGDDEFRKSLLVAAARNAVENKKEDRAIELYDQAIPYGEYDARVELEFADLLHKRGLYARAEEYYEYLVNNIVSIAGDDEFRKRLLVSAARNAVENKKEDRAIELYDQAFRYEEVDAGVKQEFADLLHKRGLYARAEEYYEYLVKNIGSIAGEDDEFRKRLLVSAARNAVENKKEDRAIELYDQAFWYGEFEAGVELEFADLLHKRGHHARAEEYYEYLVKDIGNIAGEDDEFRKRLLVSAARNAVENKKEDRAIELYDQAFGYGELQAGVKLEFADLLHKRGHHALAEEYYEYLVKNIGSIAGEDDEFRKRLLVSAARNAVENKKEDRAIELYDQAFGYGELQAGVKLEFADLLHKRGHHARAEEYYEYLVKNIGSMAGDDEFRKRLFVSAARNAVENKKQDRAIELYDQVLLLGKIDSKVVEEIAGVFARFEKFDQTLELCEKILLDDPFDPEVLILKVGILVHLKRYTEARNVLVEIPYKEKNVPQLLQLEADVEAWSRNYNVAVEKYQKLVEQFPDDSDIWIGYLKVLSWAKMWSLIINVMEEGEGKFTSSDDVRSVLAEAYLSLGKEKKAVEIWESIDINSILWRSTLLKIVDKFLSRKNLIASSDILEKVLSDNKHEVYVVSKLAVVYTYQKMPEKGLEILNQFPVTHNTQHVIDVSKAEILSLTGRYDEALSLLRNLELNEAEEIGLRGHVVELECYYAMEEDEKLLEKSSLILRKLYNVDLFDKAKVLILQTLSQIRMGLYEQSEEGIESLSEIQKEDLSPAILTVLLNHERRSLKEYEKSIKVLGRLLSEYSFLTEIVRPELFELIPPSAWNIADEYAKHLNQEVTLELAKAELNAGNLQRSSKLFEELYEKFKDTKYKLGMFECYLNLQDETKIVELSDEIQILELSTVEFVRYLDLLVKTKINKENFYSRLSLFPKNVSLITDVRALTIILNLESGDYESAKRLIEKYLSNHENLALFQAIVEKIGYFDKGKTNNNYAFASDWQSKAVKMYPDDTELRYQYAKLLATHREYDLAIEQFLILHETLPENVRILRWLAQVNSWKQEYDKSLKFYDLYARKRPNDSETKRQIARVNSWALRRKDSEAAYKKLCEDLPEDYEIYWEWQAKKNNWLGRKRTAISFYDKLIETHPKDPELLFDLGQMYSMLNFSVKAENYYKDLLSNEPEHNRAVFADESEQWRRKQSLNFKPSYIRQKGSGDDFGSIDITMYRTDIEYLPLRISEAMDISFGLGNTIFKFKRNGGSDAQHLTLNLNKSFKNGISTKLAGKLTSYSENRHETTQFDADINYRLFDIFNISLLGGREDVLQNNITLHNRRGRYYNGGSLTWDITERIDVFGQVKQYWYNDSNAGTEFYTSAGYKLSLYPKILKCMIETYGYDVRSQRNEYWSPVKYRKYMAGISWRHYLGREHFSGAPELFYEVSVKQGVDVDGIDFTEPKFQLGWDNKRHWNMGLEIKPMRSAVYDEERAGLFFNYRF